MTFDSKSKTSKLSQIFLSYILPFSIIFLILQFIIFYPFLKDDKSFIWNVDGINQHYPSLLYFGQMLKDLLKGNGFKMIDFNVGMGFDTITTLNYYAIGDPITLFTVFSNADNMEIIYKFLIIVRLYLAGISFILYCINMKKDPFPSTMGAMIYVFCGFSLYASVRHPYFTNPMIYLPLLLIGLELIFRKGKPAVFIVMTFISALSNFYFFYMLTIIIFIYAIIRFFHLYKGTERKKLFQLLWKTAFRVTLFYLLGVAMSAVILLPVIAAFFNNGRFHTGYSVNLVHYTKEYYVLMAYSFFAANATGGYWTQLTYTAITAISIWMLFRSKKHRELLIGFLLLTLCLMLPIVGYTMNGFSYVSNRWVFGYSLLIAYAFVTVYKDMFSLKRIDKIILILGGVLYAAGCMIWPTVYGFAASVLLFISIATVLFFNHFKNFGRLKNGVIFVIIFCNLVVNGYLTYDSRFGNYVGEFIDSGKVQSTINNSAVSMISDISDDSFYRVESFGDKKLNEALTNNYNDVSGYFSIMDKRVSEFMKGLELVNQKSAYRFDNLDARAYTSTLAGVKYLVTNQLKMAPYGYTVTAKKKNKNKTYYTLVNQNALSLGYTYKQYITRDVYESLTALQKQEIMLRAVVLEEPLSNFYSIDADSEDASGTNPGNTFFSEIKLDSTIEFGEGITQEGNSLKVTKEGAKMRVNFGGVDNAETYIRFENFNINDTDYYTINFKVKGEGGVTKYVNVRPQWHSTYFGKQNYLVNLGYKEKAVHYAEITFSNVGDFNLDGLQVYTLPMDNYDNLVKERADGELKNITMGNNKITAVSQTDEASILCLSIPYSKGWRAYVNGKETKLLQANVMYMGIPLESGNNSIELRYETPYLREGAAVSGIGWFIFLAMIIFHRFRYKKAAETINNN